ncbi:MAG: hypothetical protein HYZ22_19235 [Chloroflexi bacterium]|nr:hypothetical protein [Chloroflexota bacterium]
MSAIPLSLKPFFQEYDITKLTPEKDSHTIIERVLQFGNRAEIKWLFETYPKDEISNWVRRWGNEVLPEPDRKFWKIVLNASPK